MVLMGILVWFSMPSLMLIEHKSPLSYEETVAALNDVIGKKQNWKVPKTFDFQKNTDWRGRNPALPRRCRPGMER